MNLYGKNTEAIAQRIIEAFQHPTKLPKALTPIFIHRSDDLPCRNWSFCNQLLIAMSGTSDARGMKQWNAVDRKVKKGSKAIWILAPYTRKVKSKGEEEETKQIVTGFRSVPVFAYESTEGEPLPEQDDSYKDFMTNLPLSEVANQWNIRVDVYGYHPGMPLGYYRHSGDEQTIMLGVEDTYTWLHELVHSADGRIGGLKKATWHKEIVAELGSAILMECLGFQHEADLGGAYQYIDRYARSEQKDIVKACIEVLDHTCRCVSLILDTAEQISESVPA